MQCTFSLSSSAAGLWAVRLAPSLGHCDGCSKCGGASISVYVDLEPFEFISRRDATCLAVGKSRAEEGKHTNTHSLPPERVKY